jgi:hypothetical protein
MGRLSVAHPGFGIGLVLLMACRHAPSSPSARQRRERGCIPIHNVRQLHTFVGWAKSRAVTSQHGTTAPAILPTRDRCHELDSLRVRRVGKGASGIVHIERSRARLCPPYGSRFLLLTSSLLSFHPLFSLLFPCPFARGMRSAGGAWMPATHPDRPAIHAHARHKGEDARLRGLRL